MSRLLRVLLIGLCFGTVAHSYTTREWESIDKVIAATKGVTPKIATFDWDGTILSEKPFYGAIEYFIHESDVEKYIKPPAGNATKTAAEFVYRDVRDWAERYRWQIRLFGGKNRAEVEQRAAAFYEKFYGDTFFAEQLKLVERLRAAGFEIYVISGSMKFAISSFASKHLKLDESHIIGTGFDISSDVMPAQWNGLLIDREVKVRIIREQLPGQPQIAVGNSSGDLPMLEHATRLAIIVNPDEKAKKGFEDIEAKGGKQKRFIATSLAEPQTEQELPSSFLRDYKRYAE